MEELELFLAAIAEEEAVLSAACCDAFLAGSRDAYMAGQAYMKGRDDIED